MGSWKVLNFSVSKRACGNAEFCSLTTCAGGNGIDANYSVF